MSSPIKEVLQTLSRHAETVEGSLGGVISALDGVPGAAIVALRQASALRPVGEDGYRLHPRLREYLQDHLQLFPAFQSLAEIGSRISQVTALWEEVLQVSDAADHETVASLSDSLQMTAFDIADNMERNTLLLHTLMSTRFGNVRSLAAKNAQNRYYQQQAASLTLDLGRLAKVCEKVEREASERGMQDLARSLRRAVLSRIMAWQQGLSEMQTEIRKALFRTREVERNLKQLARMDMLLRQQPGWRGLDVDLGDEVPAFLLATRLPTLRPHVEPLDADREMVNAMESVARTLPRRAPPVADRGPPRRWTRIVDPPAVPIVTPATKAMQRLVDAVNSAGDMVGDASGLSLVDWREGDEDALSMSAQVWLVFAVVALRSHGLAVTLVENPLRDGDRFRHTFRDALAYRHPRNLVLTQQNPASRVGTV